MSGSMIVYNFMLKQRDILLAGPEAAQVVMISSNHVLSGSPLSI